MKLVTTTALLSLVVAQQAIAQSALSAPGEPGTGNIRTVTLSLQMSVPAPTSGTVEDVTRAVSDANDVLYKLIDRECTLLADVMKGTCRVVRFGAGSNYNQPVFNPMMMGMANRGMLHPTVSANVNATFSVDVPARANTAPGATPATPSAAATKP